MKNKAAQSLGRLGGRSKSEAKSEAARANGSAGGRPGMYSVLERPPARCDEICHGSQLSKTAAKKIAAALAASGKPGVFVEFFRKSDNQRGYLNQDGSHQISGVAWS